VSKAAFVLMACWTLAAANAATAETSAEHGKRVIDDALKALGGDAFLHMEDRVESGRAYGFHNGELSGLSLATIYTRYVTRPEPPVADGKVYLREREALGKDQSDAVLFNEQGAWEITWRGARPLSKERYDNWQDSTLRDILYILRQRLDEPGLVFLWQRSDFYENLPVDIVEISDAQNRNVTVYFSQLTKLPVRQEFRRRNPTYKDFDTEVTVFAKYRDAGGGVIWPYDIRRDRNGEKIFEMYSDSVSVNKDLTDDLFTLPGNLKILKK
jgi:hypothetical protein